RCGSATLPGRAGAGTDGGVHGQATRRARPAGPRPRPRDRHLLERPRRARPRGLAGARAAGTARWAIGASSTPTCLTAWGRSAWPIRRPSISYAAALILCAVATATPGARRPHPARRGPSAEHGGTV